MIRVEKSMMIDEKIAQLNQIKTIMQEHNDPIRVQQMSELVEKLKHGGLYIAVCGHFSAGKSSLINKLCGINYLPSGPIPASANVVTIRDGEPSSTVIHHSKDARQQNKRVQVPLQELESYCLNGSAIARVELSVPSVLLRDNNITLLDTPGIDSTDERHHQATSAALHLADIVFYVVDYNHVESEHNLQFAKRVKELGKPFYLLINQIDKHREQELPLAKFRQREIGRASCREREEYR